MLESCLLMDLCTLLPVFPFEGRGAQAQVELASCF